MRLFVAFITLTFLVSLPGPILFAQEKKKHKPGPPPAVMLEAQKYFPMARGNWWEYKTESISATDPDRDEGKSTRKVVEIRKDGCLLKEVEHNTHGSPDYSTISIKVKNGYIIEHEQGSKGKWHIFRLPPRVAQRWANIIVMTA